MASTFAALDPRMQAINPRVSITPLAFMVFLFGLASYYIGLRTSRTALGMKYLPVLAGMVLGTLWAYFVLNLNPFFAFFLNVAALVIVSVLMFSKLRFEYVFGTGLFLFWLNFLLVGIPLLDPQLHVQLLTVVNPMFVLGFMLMMYSLIRLYPRHRYLWLVALFSAVLSTYRIYMGVVFITWLWLEKKNLKGMDYRKAIAVILGMVVVVGAFLSIGYIAKVANSGSWSLDPLSTFEYRLALTMGVFEDIVGLSFPLGHTSGRSITMEATEFNCMVLYGCTERITATAFGEAMLDFGLVGVFLVAWFAGAVLGNLHRHDFPLYAFLFASLVVALDVGINMFLLLEYIYLGWIGLVRQWTK